MSDRALVHLYLCECEIEGVSANSAIVKFLADEEQDNRYPTHLLLHRNRLGDRGTVALAKSLLGMQWLKVLDLRTCGVGEEGVAALCSALLLHKGLEQLDIRGNEVYATSGRRLVQLVRKRPTPLVVLTDLEQLPNRISEELLEAMGARAAAVHSFDAATRLEYPVVQPAAPSQSLLTAYHGLSLPQTSPLYTLVQEVDCSREGLSQLYARLGNIVLLLSLDVSPSRAMSSLSALNASVQTKAALQQTTTLQAILQRVAPALLPPAVPLAAVDGSAPCSRDDVWDAVGRARGPLLKEQWDTIARIAVHGNDAPGGWEDSVPSDPTTPPDAVVSPIVLLGRLIRGIAGISSTDIPDDAMGAVDTHIDKVYTQVVAQEYEQRRTFALVCQRIGYLIQNHRPTHASWKKEASTLSRPARVDRSAFVDKTAQWFQRQDTSAYALQRLELVREALRFLPPLMVKFLVDVVCEDAVAVLYRGAQCDGYQTLFDLMTQDTSASAPAPRPPGAVKPVAPPPARLASDTPNAPPRLVAGATAEANAIPLNLCGDIASVLGSIRTVDHAKQLVRYFGQWLRWQHFIGRVEKDAL